MLVMLGRHKHQLNRMALMFSFLCIHLTINDVIHVQYSKWDLVESPETYNLKKQCRLGTFTSPNVAANNTRIGNKQGLLDTPAW